VEGSLEDDSMSSNDSMYSMALRRISTLGSRWPGLLLVRRFSDSKASLTYRRGK
jgi:hypothetical protein